VAYGRLGLDRRRGLGRCGLCGQQRQMTEAHVPPKAAGNRWPDRQRALWVMGKRGAQLSGWQPGGLSVYGLCGDCNHVTSERADPAYIDFHRDVSWLLDSPARRLLSTPGDLPARVAPGLVARSVLAGMFATNDNLYDRMPELAEGIRAGRDDLRLPEDLRLLMALTPGPMSRLGGPVGYMQVLTTRRFHMPLAEVWFAPLVWCLRSARETDPSLGPDFTSGWADATGWVRYGSELVTDLRNVIGALPVTWPPQFGADEWLILSSDEAMTAVEGRPTR
jgi:hypothetical protein